MIIGGISLAIGLLLLAGGINQWWLSDIVRLKYRDTMRWVIFGATLTRSDFMLSGFFVSILGDCAVVDL